MRAGTGLVALVTAVGVSLLSGCATTPSAGRFSLEEGRYARPVELRGVPFFPQEEYHCGPAALASTLTWSGIPISPEALNDDLFIPAKKGTLQIELIAQARRRGRLVYRIDGHLGAVLDELNAGHPVLVLENLGLGWFPVWHYSVVFGFEPDRGQLLLHSGTQRRRTVSLETFARTWGRSESWAVVVLPPDRLPATADVSRFLKSAFSFEAFGDTASANRAYTAALERWPQSAAVHFALGNSLFERDQYANAAKAYRQATSIDNSYGAAHNNLALALAEQSRWEEALLAAKRAVDLGGAFAEEYRDTLETIRHRRSEHMSSSTPRR